MLAQEQEQKPRIGTKEIKMKVIFMSIRIDITICINA